MTTKKKLKADAIRIDGGTQPRAAINQATVAEYADEMKAGHTFPPVTVFFDGAEYWLADGYHRYFAATRSNPQAQIVCDVVLGTQRDAVLHSIGANHAHGLRRTNADKHKAVETLLQDAEWGGWTDHEIARRAGVSHTFVAELRKDVSLATVASENGQSDLKTERKYVNKHGQEATINTAGIAAANKARTAPETDGYGRPLEAPEAKAAVTVAERAAGAKVEYDTLPPPEPPQTDEEWLRSLPLYRALTAFPHRGMTFQSEAMAWRRMAKSGTLRHLAQSMGAAYPSSNGQKASVGPLHHELSMAAHLPPPEEWGLCPKCDGSTLAGGGTCDCQVGYRLRDGKRVQP